MSVTSWFLVSSSGSRHRLPKEMIFVGRDDCELMLQSRSVDKQHAVINYNATTDEHLVKDLGSLNGTFVNDLRIPDQTYITLKVSDVVRFGYDILTVCVCVHHKVPEEALKVSVCVCVCVCVFLSNSSICSPSCRPTPLYGQPSWWGEEDVGSKVQSACEPVPGTVQTATRSRSSSSNLQNQVFCVDPNFSGSLHDVQPKAVFSTYNPQPNYFEIPTKDLQHSRSLEEELQEIPTKDTDKSTAPPSPPTPTPPIVQSHASFTIEFDDCSPGKIKIKDHVTKFSTRQRVHQNPPHRTAVKTTPVDVMSSESKVADWLVHTDVSMMRRRPVCEDVFSTKSDLAINIRTLKGQRSSYVSFHSHPPLEGPSQGPSEHLTQQAFVIEFFDDNPRKKRSQSFTHNTHSDTYSALKAKLERRKVGERPASVHGHVSLKSRSGPQRSSSLKREKTEGEAASTSVPPQSSPGIIIRPFGSVGKKSKLAQEFVAELLKQPTHAEGELSPVPMSAPPVMLCIYTGPGQTVAAPTVPPLALRTEEEDSLSDAGTYTIETESQDQEVEEARHMIDQAAAALEEPKWVSCWASLAGGYAEPGYDCSESESSFSCRTRRLLPQVPPEKSSSATPGILIYCEPHKDLDHTDTVVAPPSAQGLSVHDDVDPDSLSDASRSDDAPVLERTKSSNAPGALSPDFRDQDKLRPLTKSTFFYIGSEDSSDKPDQICSIHQSEKSHDPLVKPPATTVLIRHLSGPDPRRSGVKPNSSAPDLHTQNKDSILTKDNGASCFVRQESFTRDRPSDGIQLKKLPHISSHPSLRDLEQRKNTIQDTQCSPQETEGTLFSLDNRFPTSDSGRSSKRGGSSSHVEDSLSGESDVDTASTVSHVSSKNAMTGSTPKKHRVISGLKKEKSSSSPSIQEKGRQLSARERLSEKRRSQNNGEPSKKVDAAKSLQMRRSTGTCGSLDLSEGQQGSGPNWCENVSSDQETSHPPGRSKKLQKDTNRKMPKTPTQQVLTRSNSLSAPRPTRASMLRRARLGEASDNEGAETDRGSQNSDNITTSSKVATEGKKLSRLDILAMPRKRTGSFTAPSDSEVTGRVSVFTRNASRASARKASEGEVQPANRSRRRQKDSEYSSSSEEEYPVHKDSSQFISSAHTSQAHWTSTRSTSSKSPPLEMEDNDEQNQVDAYQNWSTHTAEIAKLSQDLAKDLAILAREIHDVAGDGDSMSACTPASTISTREELVQQIPELGLNFQKVPPGPGPPEGDPPFSERDANMNPPESGSEQRRTWNREEVILDNLMLNPVWQLSQDIRQNTEQLAQNMKVLFQNKVQVWEQTEARINAENDIPILKTSNKEISSIIKELRRVQRQLRGKTCSLLRLDPLKNQD
uniref:Centrosomal protein 170B n=1 Tax=Cynoglossus semilaevis TaxID=244447 RepID=A0A3P8V896_CYNSE